MNETRRRRVYEQLSCDPVGDGQLTLLNWILVGAILLAVIAAMLATEPILQLRFGPALATVEYLCGVVFVGEYGARLWTAPETPGSGGPFAKRGRFVFSLLGLLDLAVIVLTFLPLVVPGLAILRIIRLLRLIMLAKFGRFSGAFRELAGAIHARRYELYVTIALAVTLLVVGATLLFLVEGPIQWDKFGSIPRALWWSIITLTTVGYGDVSPVSPLGKMLASIVALIGIGMVALPTGILAAAFSDAMERRRNRND